jgi:hypothetical protein
MTRDAHLETFIEEYCEKGRYHHSSAKIKKQKKRFS